MPPITIREERILKSGSPIFTISVPSINPGESQDYDLAEEDSLPSTAKEARKYLPLDYCEVTNDDPNCAVSLVINQVESLYIPAATIKSISGKNMWRIAVKNNDASTATTAGKIKLVLQRQPITVDKYLRKYKLGRGRLFE
ncbi:MAG TPA: hypothetical protein G4O01_02900 [Dehalococcoidia bacterium]|jgi:hypothetical protein|nr:hypothetical protein [Dehalococcoidia bacterium]